MADDPFARLAESGETQSRKGADSKDMDDSLWCGCPQSITDPFARTNPTMSVWERATGVGTKLIAMGSKNKRGVSGLVIVIDTPT